MVGFPRSLAPLALAAAWLAAAPAACSSAEPPAPIDGPRDGDVVPPASEAGAPDAPPDAAPQGLRFGTCPGAYSGVCAAVDMPLDAASPSGKTVSVLLNKIVTSPRPTAQLWVLQGGPGGTAADMAPLARDVADHLDGLEIYTLEHRGVGASNRLGCPLAERAAASSSDAGPDAGPRRVDELACLDEVKAAYGADLQHYTTTNAARDLARAIELTRRPGLKVYVYGVSYGTAWAQRFLQVAPKHADAVVLDSLVVPGRQFLSMFTTQADPVGRKLAEVCKADPSCAAALGPDPWATIVATKQKLDRGHCPELGLTPRDREAFTLFMRVHALQAYAFAAWVRLDRCAPDDVTALRLLLSRKIFTSPNEGLSSDVLGSNIAFSELWESPPPSQETLSQRYDDAVFPTAPPSAALQAAWPKYAADEHVGKLPDAQVPVLVMNGTFDTQTPIELSETTKAHYSLPGRTFVTIPYANHNVIAQSPLPASGDNPPEHCGMAIMTAFLKSPGAPVDTSCVAKVVPPSFTRPSPEVTYLLGTTALFSGAPVRGPGVPLVPVTVARARSLPRAPLQGAVWASGEAR